MTFTIHQPNIRTLKSGDKHFQIRDNYTLYSRASFEISKDCPREYMQIIQRCCQNGWLTPVANITEREMIFLGLADE